MANSIDAMEFEPVIGLEVHVQLQTRSKMFCGCDADYQDASPNEHAWPVCLDSQGPFLSLTKPLWIWSL